jgi:hypothetical protein
VGRAWAPEEALLRYAALAVVRPPTIEAPAHIYPPTVSTRVPRLVAERDTGDAVELVNTGNADAYGITVEPLPGMGDAWVPVGEIPPGRISPGARWRAGILAPSLADVGPYVLWLTWRDASGRTSDGEFPVG